MVKKFPSLLLSALIFISCSKEQESNGSTEPETNVLETNAPEASTTKPNILLIIADDMGLDASPGYPIGTVKPNMPNLELMITDGIRFNNVWANPTCTPTRASILTGKYGFRVGVTKVDDVLSTSEISLQDHLDTTAPGYANAVIGKWHLSKNPNHPTNIGVDYYAGLIRGSAQSYTNWNLVQNGESTTSSEYITSKFSDLAIEWLAEQNSPWFLWLAYTAPHTPFHLPPDNLHTQNGLSSDQAAIEANPLPYYMAMLEAMDTEMGRVIAALDPSVLENTIIIFIGDNGSPNQVAQQYNNRRVKGTVYQGGINVPMIVSGKGVTRRNQTENALINTTDLFTTIAEIAGSNFKEIHDSKSFMELLSDANSSRLRDHVYSEIGNANGGSDYTIRNTTHKYIRFDNGEEAFYNLSSNPLEFPNLLNENQLPLSEANAAIKASLLLKLGEIRE